MTIAHRVLVAAALGLLVTTANAQVIRGVVVDRGDLPVAGVVVQLIDSASTVTARALSNERGEFRVAPSHAGTYRIRTLRIGFRPFTSASVPLVSGQELVQRLVLSNVSVALDTVVVNSRNQCRAFTDSGAATFAVWEQVRTALTAAQMTVSERTIAATTVAYERTLDAGGRRVVQQSNTVNSDYVKQPWRTIPPDALRRDGYVVTERDNSTTYYAPGLDLLLSNGFVEDHCFRLTTDRNRLGIEFEPTPERKRVTEIRGTLWLDRASSELRRLEFRYANIPAEQETEARGDMEFVRLRNGGWAITRWNIRMPVLENRVRSQAFGGAAIHLAEIRVTGGELALVRRGGDTLWSRPPLVLAGTVVDSVSRDAIAGAHIALSGTSLEGTTDARGRFSIAGVLPGEYGVEVRTPSLDSVSAIHQTTLMFVDATTPVQIRVPTAEQIASLVCGNARLNAPGIVIGIVDTRGDSVPSRAITIEAEWVEIGLRSEGGAIGVERPRRHLAARADARGAFKLCGVPVSTQLAIRATADNAVSDPVTVQIPPSGRFARASVRMNRSDPGAATLTGQVLTDSTLQPIAGAQVALSGVARGAVTDDRGAFRISGVSAGEYTLTVRRVGYGPLDARVSLTPNQSTNRQIFLSRIVMLDSIVVTETLTDRALREFEDNRRIGLGHFFTREDLEKYSGRPMDQLFAQMPGIDLVRGKGSHSWIASSRPHIESNPYDKILPDLDAADSAKGAKRACYAHVYLDNVQIYRGTNGEPLFDLNSIAPDQIEAIEYYASRAQTPSKYVRLDSVCGVLVIHTRRSP